MIPILFPASATSYTTRGIGTLTDALSCVVTEERNGEYELALDYPMGGRFFSEIKSQAIILAKPNTYDGPQPFRIYAISRPLQGVCTVSARHISYDLAGIPVTVPASGSPQVLTPITAQTAAAAMTAMKENSAVTNPFTFTTDVTTRATFRITHAGSFRSYMGGQQGSLLDVYGGEWKYDGFTVRLLASRGADRGFQIRYGKNLLDLKQEEKCANCYTGVMAFYSTDEGEKQGGIQNTGVTLGYDRVLVLDATEEFETTPTVGQLNEYARGYIASHEMSAPVVSLTVSFAQIGAALERVSLCDTVTVIFDELGVQTQAKIVRTEYDVLLERYDKVEIGTIRTTLADTIVTAEKEIAKLPTTSEMNKAIQTATDLITGVSGGYVVINRDANGEPFELLIMDAPTIDTATKVWRWNQNGLGYSSTGYSGDYGLAMTSDGSIVADFINAGILQSGDGGETFYLDLAGGVLRMKASDLWIGDTNLASTIGQVGVNQEDIEAISGYLRYANGTVTIGDTNSKIALTVQNDRLAFVDTAKNKQLAWFTNDRLYVPNITITSSLDFGNYRIDTSNGGMTFIWVGN